MWRPRTQGLIRGPHTRCLAYCGLAGVRRDANTRTHSRANACANAGTHPRANACANAGTHPRPPAHSAATAWM
ncbi:MAG: hypothetical protein OXN95_01600 [bacterium]|nr:hypothetical protein [bacterium]